MTPQQKADSLQSTFGTLAPKACREIMNVAHSRELDWWLEVYQILTKK
jgi:hypothetical protein